MIAPRLATIAFLTIAGLCTAAAAPVTRANPLRPLSEADKNKDQLVDGGCVFTFDVARKSLVYATETLVMVRTAAGLAQCKVPARTSNAFREGKGPVMCGGQRLSIARTGKIDGPEEGSEGDGSIFPGVLTVGAGTGAVKVRGEGLTGC